MMQKAILIKDSFPPSGSAEMYVPILLRVIPPTREISKLVVICFDLCHAKRAFAESHALDELDERLFSTVAFRRI